jgi:hypothetical protein
MYVCSLAYARVASDRAFYWLHNVGNELDNSGFAGSVQADNTSRGGTNEEQVDHNFNPFLSKAAGNKMPRSEFGIIRTRAKFFMASFTLEEYCHKAVILHT